MGQGMVCTLFANVLSSCNLLNGSGLLIPSKTQGVFGNW